MNIPAVSRRRTLAAFLIICCTAAWIARDVGFEYFPPEEGSSIGITFEYPGASAEQLEQEIIIPFEAFSRGISGTAEQGVIIHPGRARYFITFHGSLSPAEAYMRTADALRHLSPLLPGGAREPVMDSGGPSERPVLILGLSADPGPGREELESLFARIEGCGRVETAGYEREALFIEGREGILGTTGMTVRDIRESLAGRSVSGVFSGDNQSPLTLDARPASVREYGDIPAGRYMRLKDLANLKTRPARKESAARINGEEQITLLLYAAKGADIMSLCASGIATARALPAAEAVVLYDLGSRTAEGLKDLLVTTAAGITAVILITLLLLKDVRAASAASGTIAFSILCTAAVFRISGTSLNMVTISGLAVAGGLVMDGAFVVVTQEKDPRTAAAALLAAVLTTLAAFFPVKLLAPKSFSPFAGLFAAVFWSLSSGYVYTLVFIPALYRPVSGRRSRRHVLAQASAALFRGGAARRRFVLLICILSGAAAGAALLFAPFREIPLRDTRMITLQAEFPAGTSLHTMLTAAAPFEKALLRVPGVLHITGRYRHEQIRMHITLGRDADTQEAAGTIRGLRSLMEGGAVLIQEAGDTRDVEVKLFGPDHTRLRRAASDLGNEIELTHPGVEVIRHFKEPGDDWMLSIDPLKTAASGITPRQLYTRLYWKFSEPVGGKAFFSGRETDIHVTAAKPAGPAGPEDYLTTPIPTSEGYAAAGEFVDPRYEASVGTIHRTGHRRVQALTLRLPPKTGGPAVRDLLEDLAGRSLPEGYSLQAGEHYLEERRELTRLMIAGLAGAASVVLIIFFYFEGCRPALVCLALGLAPLPVPLLFHLLILRQGVSTPMLLGLMLVFGVQVNNGIILLSKKGETSEGLLSRLTLKADALAGAAATSSAGLLPLLFLQSATRQFMTALLGTMAAGVIWGTVLLPVFLGALTAQKKTSAITGR